MECILCSGDASFAKKKPRFNNNNIKCNRLEETIMQKAHRVLRHLLHSKEGPCDSPKLRAFTLSALAVATRGFSEGNLIGGGQSGEVYKGHLKDTGEIVAVKELNLDGCLRIKESMVDGLMLDPVDHPNIVKSIGYSIICAHTDRMLLVHEYMTLGSLNNHLHDPSRIPLDWNTRMKIAAGAAQGLEYMQNKMKRPMMYLNMKSSNILLGDEFHPKLSDLIFAKTGPSRDQKYVCTRDRGTFGYCAPEHALAGQISFKTDIYSFGVVLLEIISGRLAFDKQRSGPEINLAAWARPLLNDRNKFHQMADPALNGQYPVQGLYQALEVAAMCIQEEPSMRPAIADIVKALSYLASQTYDPYIHGNKTPVRAPVLEDLEEMVVLGSVL